MKRKVGLICFALVLIISGIPSNNQVDADLVFKTIIKGVVTDAETGQPVENALVMIRNYTRDIYHYYETESNGSYEISIGSFGNFCLEVQGPIHEFKSTEVEINAFEEKKMDIEIIRYKHNVMVLFYNQDVRYPVDNLKVTITGDMGNQTLYQTANNGWLNLSLEEGIYSLRTDDEFFNPLILDMNVSENRCYRTFNGLSVSNVFENASKKINPNPIVVNPGEFAAVKITNNEPTSMFLTSESDERVTIIEMTGIMYDKYRSIKTGVPYEHSEDPVLEYDSKIGSSYGGGGTVVVWELPYYIVFENNNSVPARVAYELYYEYGNPSVDRIESGPLNPSLIDEDEEEDSKSTSALSFTLFILIVLIFTFILVSITKRKK